MASPPDAQKPTRLGTPPAAERIEKFLRDYRKGTLFVAVGYASTAGLAWLAKRTEGRPVKLLIGNAQPRWFKKASADDRAAALEFLRRRDVEVKNWYRKRRGGEAASEAHLKVWAVCDRQNVVTAALVGSANLSEQGLMYNVEVCVEASGKDVRAVVNQIAPLFKDAWDYRERVIRYLEGETPPGWKGRRGLGREASGDPPDTRAGRLARAVASPFRVIRTAAFALFKVFAVVGVLAVIGLVALLAVGIARGWFG